MLALNKERIKCPLPLKNKKNNFIFKVKGKSSIIVSFLNGKAKNNINFKDCKIIGNELAKLHKASKKIKYKRKNSLGYKEWLKIYKKTKNPNKNEIYNYFDTYKKNIPKNLPMGLIHGDIFPDNIFYYKNKFNGFIDFYFPSTDHMYMKLRLQLIQCVLLRDISMKKNIIFLLKVISLQETYQN